MPECGNLFLGKKGGSLMNVWAKLFAVIAVWLAVAGSLLAAAYNHYSLGVCSLILFLWSITMGVIAAVMWEARQ
jgi:hypothetical protein